MGFLVVAIDSPGHGATDALTPLAPLDASVALIASAVEALGIRRAVLVGHSMGGRLVAELAAAGMRATGPTMTSPAATRLTATRPATEGRSDDARSASSAFGGAELAIAAVLVDAIVGDLWDRMNAVLRVAPAGYAVLGAALVVDTVSTLPTLSDPRQAVKLARLVFPTGANHVRRPWRLLGPLASIMRAAPSGDTLDRLSAGRVPVFVIHGERDMPVPVCTARSAALRAGADLVVVRGARHSWLLRDPATFPAILAELLRGRLGEALRVARDEAGIGPDASLEAVQAAFCEPGALVADLSPGLSGAPHRVRSRRPRYRWTTRAAAGAAPASNVARDGVATAAGDVEPSGDSPHGHGDLGCGC
jgi:pimeloyl-ACP methyl ester carboxylesterase